MNARSRRRHGTALVETVVAMFLYSTVLTMAIMLLNALFQLEGRVKSHADSRLATARLARQFRHDVRHASAVVDPPPEGAVLALRLGDEQEVTYRLDRGEPSRVVAGPGDRRVVERFRLPARAFVVEKSDAPGRFLVLHVDRRTSNKTAGAPRPIRIVANLSADLRFDKPVPSETPP